MVGRMVGERRSVSRKRSSHKRTPGLGLVGEVVVSKTEHKMCRFFSKATTHERYGEHTQQFRDIVVLIKAIQAPNIRAKRQHARNILRGQ